MFNWIKEFFTKKLTATGKLVINLRINKSFQRPKENIISNSPLVYLLNDPTTPRLFTVIKPPKETTPSYFVRGYKGGGFSVYSDAGRAARVFVTITYVINYYKNMGDFFHNWAATKDLLVDPNAGRQLNAYYNRSALKFFADKDPHGTAILYASDSVDIVSHELGHALLDSMRPDIWNDASLETWAFHEAFGDYTAMIGVMQTDQLLNYMLKETNGDIHKNNIVSKIAEQFGDALFVAGSGREHGMLRNAINDYKYVNPATLPKNAPYNKLSQDPHSFGRIFLGSLYDILAEIYIYEVWTKGTPRLKSLKIARDLTTRLFLAGTKNAPRNIKFFESVAKTMIWITKNNTNFKLDYLQEIVQRVFVERNIISQVKMLSNPMVDIGNGEARLVIVDKSHKHKIENGSGIQMLSNGILNNIEIDMPMQSAYFVNENNIVEDEIIVSDIETKDAIEYTIGYILMTNDIGSNDDYSFSVKNGCLERNSIS